MPAAARDHASTIFATPSLSIPSFAGTAKAPISTPGSRYSLPIWVIRPSPARSVTCISPPSSIPRLPAEPALPSATSSHGGSRHEADRLFGARLALPHASSGCPTQPERKHHQGLPRCLHPAAQVLSRPTRPHVGTIVSGSDRCAAGRGISRSSGYGSEVVGPYPKPPPRDLARVLPLRAVGSAGAAVAVPAGLGHSAAATSSPDGRLSLQ